MDYQEYKPIELLSKYIDSYWIIQTDNEYKTQIQRIIPDCCNDIIINMGSEIVVNGGMNLLNDKSYFVGNMTKYNDTIIQSDSKLIGIRFKPFGVNNLLGFTLEGTTNKINELGTSEFNFKSLLT